MKKTITFLLALVLAPVGHAAEGMWMPQQIPQLSEELRSMGLQIDPNRFADLTGDPMGAVISLGGCTASFVSPEGLVVTNHHCAFGSIQHNSSAERDLIKNGFLAASRAEELPAAPGSRVFVTTNIEDVTHRVTGNLSSRLGDADRARAMERRERQLVDECERPGGVRCRVASFFEGSQYLRTTQMEIRDVRLVYAPGEGIGNYGGETDNWMWPRHTGDFAFYRAYVGPDGRPADFSRENVPYRPAHWLKVAQQGVKPGELVMVAGYPGRTFRYRTAQEVATAREFTIPTTIRYASDLSAILHEAGKGNRETQIRNASRINGFENLLKNYHGTIANMNRGTISEHRAEREAALAAWIGAQPDRTRRYGDVVSRLDALSQELASTRERDLVLTYLYRSSPMLAQAQRVYRWSVEKPKKDLDRAGGFRDRDVPPMLQASARAQRSFDAPSDRAGLRYMLLEAARLPAGQRISAIDQALAATGATGTEAQVEALLDRLYASTKIGDAEERKAMYAETRAQLDARRDSLLSFAAALLPQSLAGEERGKRVAGAMSRVRPLYLQALREMSGGRLYPDANSTLRISFGRVEGYEPRDAVRYEPQTTLSGVLAKHTGEGEFDAPAALLEAARSGRTEGYRAAHLEDVPVNFLSTLDTTGGNSGSPVLNARGELTGLLFDGNFEALGSDYLVDPDITRSISVDAMYMLWVMDAVDRAHNVMREMGIEPR
ncbi:MAG TPA: S46 family peptidase [Thermoanaerobaculia bacterium]|nr:S46 family peptidase [Thermoanaerobaculia bacterium]